MTARFSTGVSKSIRFPNGMSYQDVFDQGYWIAARFLRDEVIDIAYYGSSRSNIGHYSKSMSKAWGACALYKPPNPRTGGGRCKMIISTSSKIPWMQHGIEQARVYCRHLWIHEVAWHFMAWTTGEPSGNTWNPIDPSITSYLIQKYGATKKSQPDYKPDLRKADTLYTGWEFWTSPTYFDEPWWRRWLDKLFPPAHMLYTFDARDPEVNEFCVERGVFSSDVGKLLIEQKDPQFVSFLEDVVPIEWTKEN